jgi:hypothetical protein
LVVKKPERVEKWGEKTAAGVVGAWIGFLSGCFVATNFSLPDEFKHMVVPISTSGGTGAAVLIVIQMDKRKKRMDEERKKIENHQRLEEVRVSRTILLDTLDKHPELGPLLLQPIKDNFQTETILLRADSTGAVQVLPLSNDLPSNLQQNILPPAPDTENPT